jgi:hypothetical protein
MRTIRLTFDEGQITQILIAHARELYPRSTSIEAQASFSADVEEAPNGTLVLTRPDMTVEVTIQHPEQHPKQDTNKTPPKALPN